MDDGHRRRICLLGLACAVAGPAAAGTAPAAVSPAPDEEFGALLEFLADPELGGEDWTRFFDSLGGDLPPEPVPPDPAPAAGESP